MSDQNLTHINFCAINRFSSSYKALNTMRSNVVKSNTFLSFSFELMMELIQSDDLHAEEEEAYESIMMWLKYDLKERLKCLPELFKSIRLSLMSVDYLDDIVQEEELIRSDITSMSYLCSAYKVVHQQEKSLVNVLTSTFNVTHRKFSKKLQSYLEKEKSVENDNEDIEEQEKSVESDDEECDEDIKEQEKSVESHEKEYKFEYEDTEDDGSDLFD
ncbi:kelch-like protein 12 [Metopolophium dirhodum]|uniref:kelch-like protein 12 n=1 Tax=Metopolophium dirhodum TaxID=44670 RepID=UPI00298F8758|nr:kelch-like protein 12 [Metopolophium dirhodum]